MSVICTGLYPCNRWNCNSCSRKKVYWLREQALQFSRSLAIQETSFITLKGFKNAAACELATRVALDHIKAVSKRYNAKLEYFYVISNHEFSGWHSHIVVNGTNFPITGHIETTRNLKNAVLYMIGNLERSAAADYGKVRRYGGSSLLYKQSMKNWYKLRARLWKLKTKLLLAMVLYRALSYRDCSRSCEMCDKRLVVGGQVATFLQEFLPLVNRPPPRNYFCS